MLCIGARLLATQKMLPIEGTGTSTSCKHKQCSADYFERLQKVELFSSECVVLKIRDKMKMLEATELVVFYLTDFLC